MSSDIPVRGVASQPPIEGQRESFISFVERQIDLMQSYVNLGKTGEVTFFELNSALCNYQSVYLTLIAMYNMAKVDYETIKEEWDSWYASIFIQVRTRENRMDIAAQKWMSTKELEMIVRSEYQAEFALRHDQLLEADRKVDFLRRLLEAWQSQQFILSTLSKNLQSEVSSESTN